jgi:CRP-like cAMP-binding protein
MLDPTQDTVTNRLLKMMPVAAFERLRPHLTVVDLQLRDEVVSAHVETTHVHFIERGIASIITIADQENDEIEVGHVGWEGMTGAHVILGSFQTPNRTMIQASGQALRMNARLFLQALKDEPSLHWFLLRYVQTCEIQVAQSALANGRYTIRERLARWLLMCHDRTEGDNLELTHEFLSIILGVRRSGITDQIHIFEGDGIVKATRGHLQILDRPRMEDLAGGCYGMPEREYDRLMGIPTYTVQSGEVADA